MKLNRDPLPELIKTAILQAIVSGEMAPGDRLVELKLAEQFGVSQSPVRDALRDLETVGLVTKKPNQGTFVGDFAKNGMSEIFAVRGGLEELATRLALPVLIENIESLQHEVDAMVSAARAGDAHELSVHSLAFHGLIIDSAQNTVLSRMWRSLHIETHTQAAVLHQIDELVALASSHQVLVDTIASGDIDQACAAARDHQAALDAIVSG